MRRRQACLHGDARASDRLLRRYRSVIYRFAFSLAHNPDDAADITAEALARLYQHLPSYRMDASFSSWLFRIVRNIYVDNCRCPYRRLDLSLDAIEQMEGEWIPAQIVDPLPTPEERLIAHERQAALRHAISHLRPFQRRMMELYHIEGRTYEQIARQTGLSIGTVESRLSRARQMLRERLNSVSESLFAG